MIEKILEYLTEHFWPRLREHLETFPRWTKRLLLFTLILVTGAVLAYEIHPVREHALLFNLWIATTFVIAAGSSLATFRHIDLPRGDHFGAPGAQIATLLGRNSYAKRVLAMLSGESPRIVIVTGQSGVGKSTLIQTILKPALEAAGFTPIPIVGFEGKQVFETQLREALPPSLSVTALGTDPKFARVAELPATPLLILDQFEQLLLRGREEPATLTWFRAFLEAWWHDLPSARCVLVVRQDLYFDLAFLSEGMDLFGRTMPVSGLSPGPLREGPDPDEDDRSKTRQALGAVVNDNDTVNAVLRDLTNRRALLPLELQIVGLMLEDIKRRRRTDSVSVYEYETSLGGREGLIREYFLRHIHAAADAETAAAVLHALSVRRVVHRVTLAELQRVTHRRKHVLEHVLGPQGPLRRGGLVLRSPSGAYQIAHDYLAHAFHDLSALRLEADDRDNIAYFSESRTSTQDTTGSADAPTWPLDSWYALLGLILVARLVLPMCTQWARDLERITLGTPPTPAMPALSFLSMPYLPSFLASFSSAGYTWQIYRNYLCRLPNRGVTRASILITSVMILAGTVWTSAWLVCASVAGLVIAAALRTGYSSTGVRWLLKYKNFLTQTTFYFFIYMVTAFVLGMGLATLRYPWFGYADRLPSEFGYALETALSLIIVVFLFRSWGKHATADGGSLMLGTRDRMRRR